MALLDDMLAHNKRWVQQRTETLTGQPRKKVAIFTCIDTRLVGFLEPALGIDRGDAKVIKNAGNTLVSDDGGVVRSLLVATCALGCEEVLVIGHHGCGMAQIDEATLQITMEERGIPSGAVANLAPSFSEWLGAFHDPAANVKRVVDALRNNPLLPADVPIHGLIIDPDSGTVDLIVDGSLT